MLFRDRVALGFSPLFIRLALAVTFLWAGAGKLFYRFDVQGQQAAVLANMGVDIPVTGAPMAPPPDEQPDDASPDADTGAESTPAEQPAEQPAEPPAEETQPEETPAEEPAEEEPPVAMLVQQQTTAPGAFTAEQFPTPVPVRRLHNVSLMLHDAVTPGDNGRALLPEWMGAGARPRYLAWLAALTEFFGGAFILIGFFTRFWALGVAGTMAMALWITQIGPVVVGGAAGTLGFLPALQSFQPAAWQTFLWQFALLCAGLSLFFSGPGPVAFDLLFAPRRDGSKPRRARKSSDAQHASA